MQVVRVYVERLKQRIEFLAPDGGDVFFYAGNPAARIPAYDLAAVLGHRKPMPVAAPAVEGWKMNADYRPARIPWTDRYPVVLYLLLGTAIVGMGLATILFLMKVRKA